MPSVEGHPNIAVEDTNINQIVYSWMVEECILAAYGVKAVCCPTHSDISLMQIAPDTVCLPSLFFGNCSRNYYFLVL